MSNKVCSKCHEEKPFEAFTNNRTRKDGKADWCRVCLSEYHITRYAANPKKYAGYSRESRDRKAWAVRLLDNAAIASKSRKASGQECAVRIDRAYLEDLWGKQKGLCYFSGVAMVEAPRSMRTVSIDRLDASKGYEPGNVVLSTFWINRARLKESPEETFQMIRDIRAAGA